MNLSYVKECRKLFDLVTSKQDSILHELFEVDSFKLKKSIKLIDFIPFKDLKSIFRERINSLIDEKLDFCLSSFQNLRDFKSLSYYEDTISVYSSFYLFWVWGNNVNISEERLSKVVDSIFLGVIGYKLIDVYLDGDSENPRGKGHELPILGHYMIHQHEQLLHEVFDNLNMVSIINKYVKMFTEVEFVEKANFYKGCPFTYDNYIFLGYKTAPLFAAFEPIFLAKGVPTEQINKMIRGLLLTAAIMQVKDDLNDVIEDLNSGMETFATAGFYKKYGTNTQITREKVYGYITEDKLQRIYQLVQSMFDETRTIFHELDDSIFQLLVEVQYHYFLKNVEFSE